MLLRKSTTLGNGSSVSSSLSSASSFFSKPSSFFRLNETFLSFQRWRWRKLCIAISLIVFGFIFYCTYNDCLEKGQHQHQHHEDRSHRHSGRTPPPEWVKKWVTPNTTDYNPTFTVTSPLRFSLQEPRDVLNYEDICINKVSLPKVDRNKRRIFVMSMFQSTPEAREFIPYFFDHYTSLGVPPENFLISIQTPNFTQTEYLKTKEVVEALGGTVGIVDGQYSTFLNSFAVESWWRVVPFTYHDWVIPADMDELHWYPEDLLQMLSTAEDNNWSYLQGGFIDRVREDGQLKPIQPFSKSNGTSIWKQYSLDCNLNGLTTGLRENSKGGLNYNKITLHRAYIVPIRGHHGVNSSVPENVTGREAMHLPPKLLSTSPDLFIPTYHFKWTDNAVKSIQERVETYHRLGLPWFIASRRWLKHLEAHGGKICTECPESGCKPGFDPVKSPLHHDNDGDDESTSDGSDQADSEQNQLT